MPPGPHDVAALLMVRNEQAILAGAIGHLLRCVGVRRIYVVDNGSTDGTPALLRRIAAGTGRLHVVDEPGEFRQDEVLTGLARQAAADGFGWVLPADADEFLWLRPGASLAALCRDEAVGGYRVPVCNFMQARPVRRDGMGALLTMLVAAVPVGSAADARARVGSGEIPFVRSNYPTKLLLRTAPSLRLTFGHHDAAGTAGPLIDLAAGELLHAPIRSPGCLRRRMAAARRVEHVTPEPGQSWHLKRLLPMDDAELAQEWRANSFSPLHPVRAGQTRWDTRLSHIAVRQLGFARRYAG